MNRCNVYVAGICVEVIASYLISIPQSQIVSAGYRHQKILICNTIQNHSIDFLHMYNDFHMKECISGFQTDMDLLCIDHCREGRIEQEVGQNAFSYLEAGDLRVDRRIHHSGKVEFPLCHYHGISIGFQVETAAKEIPAYMKGFSVDLYELQNKYCSDRTPYVIPGEPAIEHKVNGSPPGEELCKRSYSVPDAAEILKVKPETIYTLIRQGKLKTETADFCMRIPKEDFERWYRSQSRYRTAADRERDREIEAQTISIPEMAKLLGIPRKNVYGILDCKKYRDCFVIERVADRPRITKKSFKAWLKSQSTYQLQKSKKETHEEPPLKLQCPKNGKYYSFQEIQAFYGISRPTLDSWVLKEGIPTMKLGRVKRIQKDAFDEVLKSKRKVEEDV